MAKIRQMLPAEFFSKKAFLAPKIFRHLNLKGASDFFCGYFCVNTIMFLTLDTPHPSIRPLFLSIKSD